MNIKKKIADIERQLEEVKASLKKEERIYVPDGIKILRGGHGIVNGSRQLHYSQSFNDWFVMDKPSDSYLMQRPYLEQVNELKVGQVYLLKWVACESISSRTDSLLYYCIYLGGGRFVYWNGRSSKETQLIKQHHDFYEVKDENN